MEPELPRRNSAVRSPVKAGLKVRVLLDARKLGDGGIGVYVEQILRGLLERRDVAVRAIVRKSLEASGLADVGLHGDLTEIVDGARPYSVDEMVMMPRRIDFSEVDVFHSPHYTLPLGIPVPSVVTIHDLIHLQYPEKSYYPLIAKQLILSAARRADRVLTVSVAVKRDLETFFQSEPPLCEKLSVIPNCVGPQDERPHDSAGYVRSRYSIVGPYFLVVSSMAKPHKGIEDLVEAYRALSREATLPVPELVVAGTGSEVWRDKISQVDSIHVLGRVSSIELRHLYAAAHYVVVPSLAEGFGLPMLEAHVLGVPVVHRPVPALLELSTDYDIVTKDFSVPALRAALAHASICRGGSGVVPQRSVERFARALVIDRLVSVYQSITHQHGAATEGASGSPREAAKSAATELLSDPGSSAEL